MFLGYLAWSYFTVPLEPLLAEWYAATLPLQKAYDQGGEFLGVVDRTYWSSLSPAEKRSRAEDLQRRVRQQGFKTVRIIDAEHHKLTSSSSNPNEDTMVIWVE
jgi:hypothetical protein